MVEAGAGPAACAGWGRAPLLPPLRPPGAGVGPGAARSSGEAGGGGAPLAMGFCPPAAVLVQVALGGQHRGERPGAESTAPKRGERGEGAAAGSLGPPAPDSHLARKREYFLAGGAASASKHQILRGWDPPCLVPAARQQPPAAGRSRSGSTGSTRAPNPGLLPQPCLRGSAPQLPPPGSGPGTTDRCPYTPRANAAPAPRPPHTKKKIKIKTKNEDANSTEASLCPPPSHKSDRNGRRNQQSFYW